MKIKPEQKTIEKTDIDIDMIENTQPPESFLINNITKNTKID